MSDEMAEKRERKISNVINEYGSRLFRFIRGRVPTNADAEDISQEVWYQLSRVVELDSIEQLSGWLFRVARNRITDSYRKQKPDLLEDKNFENEDGSFDFKDILIADSVSPEEENLKEIFWEELFKALDELPEKQRNVFIWTKLRSTPNDELCRGLRCVVPTHIDMDDDVKLIPWFALTACVLTVIVRR